MQLMPFCPVCKNSGVVFRKYRDYFDISIKPSVRIQKCYHCQGGKLLLKIDKTRNVEDDIIEFTKMQEKITIPAEYINSEFNKDILAKSSRLSNEQRNSQEFQRFLGLMESLYQKFVRGEKLKRNIFISSKIEYVLHNFVYACMIKALRHNKVVAPYIDTQEIIRLVRVQNKFEFDLDYFDYMDRFENQLSSYDVCFIGFPKGYTSRSDVMAMQEILKIRKRKKRQTIVISKMSPEKLNSIWDSTNEFYFSRDFERLKGDHFSELAVIDY
ncbi:hypothetical protein GE107_21445 [Cohnella sp. CFH 77786]|uniref:hypothetical protein n=1 Tax=Cohnella sp. CFH 77786 TaxID=2662265 RepID=UPI001C60F89F|nr:hypothetical protein [Cohnella sp. CFH 77786]MBW5448615.1 hypothetical protein [Cohnella sp. CFH 77786]